MHGQLADLQHPKIAPTLLDSWKAQRFSNHGVVVVESSDAEFGQSMIVEK